MMHVILMAALLGGSNSPQEQKPSIEAIARTTDAKGKEPPGFLCEGAANLPDGCRIDVYTYFGKKPETASHVKHSAVLVRNGRFSTAFSLFNEKNLSGDYTFRVTFNPDLQPDAFRKIAALQVDVPLKVGSDEDIARDRRAVGDRLVGEMKALVAIAEEARVKRTEGKTDAAGWGALLRDWTKRARDINARSLAVPEYRVIGLGAVVDSGFEHLTGIVMDLCTCAQRGEDRNLREGRERLDVMVAKYTHQLTGEPLDPRITRLELANAARGFLYDAVNAQDDRAPVGRKRFTQSILNLGPLVSPALRQTLIEISDAANDLFKALDAEKDVKELHAKIDARLGEVLKALPNEK